MDMLPYNHLFLPRALESGVLKHSDEGQCLLKSALNCKRICILLGLRTFIGSIWGNSFHILSAGCRPQRKLQRKPFKWIGATFTMKRANKVTNWTIKLQKLGCLLRAVPTQGCCRVISWGGFCPKITVRSGTVFNFPQ